jgi:hypothetical protein
VLATALERSQRGRKELLEQCPDPVGQRRAVLDSVLLGAGQTTQGLDLDAVSGQRAVRVAIGAQNVRQHHCVERVGLAARGSVAVPIPRHRERVDREHGAPCRTQPSDQQSLTGLDRDLERAIGRIVLGEQLQHPSQARRRVVDAFGNDYRSMFVNKRHIVMVVCPVNPATHRRHHVSFYLSGQPPGRPRPNGQCSRHDNSPAIHPGDRQRPSSGETQTVS